MSSLPDRPTDSAISGAGVAGVGFGFWLVTTIVDQVLGVSLVPLVTLGLPAIAGASAVAMGAVDLTQERGGRGAAAIGAGIGLIAFAGYLALTTGAVF